MKQYKKIINITYFYLIIQFFLYGTFLIMDLSNNNTKFSSSIKFSIIILCFCYVLLYKRSTGKSFLFYFRAALFFTIIADLFLLLLDYYLFGVLSFIIVQQFYGIIMDMSSNQKSNTVKRKTLINTFLLRMVIQVTLTLGFSLIIIRFGVQLNSLLIVTGFYFICIVMNVIRAVKVALQYSKERGKVLFAIGMILFLLCDINVGLFNMTDFMSVSASMYKILYSLSSILMWAFYAPSQVLFSLSARENW